MLDSLNKYKRHGSFNFNLNDNLSHVCNAPVDAGGIYIVQTLINKTFQIIYIGSSGKVLNDGALKIRKGGIFDRIVNGVQFDKPRKKSWPMKMRENQIETIQVFWCDTFSKGIEDIPAYVEGTLIQKYFEQKNCLPEWNKEY